ncbi:MAG: anti-sigma factor [Acidimicrobiales bacterium]
MVDRTGPHVDLGGYVLGVLTPEEASAFEAHMDGCEQCRRELSELQHLPDLLDQATPHVDPPADLEERTFAAIERAAGAEAGDAPAAVAPPVPRPRARPLRHRTVELRKVFAIAAAVLLLGFGVAVVRDASRPAPAAAQVIELTAPGNGPARAVARIRATATGGVIDMDVEGLTPPPPGTFFECWLVAADGDTPDHPRRISVGTFGVDESGRASVHWDFKADVARFPRIGVTLEADDGNPVQTTDRVLAGKQLVVAPGGR